MVPLGLLSAGEAAEVIAVRGTETATWAGRAQDMGLRIGKRVEMLTNGAGAVLVKIDASRIAVDRTIAMRILVRRS